MPIRVITPIYNIEPTCEDASLDEERSHLEFEQESSKKGFTYFSEEKFFDDDAIASSEEDLEKIQTLVSHRLECVSETDRRQKECANEAKTKNNKVQGS